MKKHSAHGDAKAVKSAVKSIFVHDILLLIYQNVSKAKQVSWSVLIFIRKYLFAEKQTLCCWKLLLTVCTPTFNYSVFQSRPKDISKACLSLPTTKTHQDKPFWQLSIVTVNLLGFSLAKITSKVHTFRIWFTIQLLDC